MRITHVQNGLYQNWFNKSCLSVSVFRVRGFGFSVSWGSCIIHSIVVAAICALNSFDLFCWKRIFELKIRAN